MRKSDNLVFFVCPENIRDTERCSGVLGDPVIRYQEERIFSLNDPISGLISDNGGRRTGVDRRRFSYSDYIPERRSGHDRRIISDRRSGHERRDLEERRKGFDRRSESEHRPNAVEMRFRHERRTPSDRRRNRERRAAFA